MRKSLTFIAVILLMLVSQAKSSDYVLTEMLQTDMGNAKMRISEDKKYLHIFDRSGKFRIIDINSQQVIKSLQLEAQEIHWNKNFFYVDSALKTLYYLDYNTSYGSSFKIYDIDNNVLIKEIDFVKETKKQGILTACSANIIYDKTDNTLIISYDANFFTGNYGYGDGGIFKMQEKGSYDTVSLYTDYFKFYQNTSRINCSILSNDNKRLAFLGLLSRSAHSMSTNSFEYGAKIAVFDKANNELEYEETKHYYYSYNDEYGTSSGEKNGVYPINIALDNTGNELYCYNNNNSFYVYSLNDKKVLFSGNRNSEENITIFPNNNKFYSSIKQKNKSVEIYDRMNHLLASSINVGEPINDALFLADSSTIVIYTTTGKLLTLQHKINTNSIFAHFNTDNKNYQIDDTVKIYDFSTVDYDSKIWKINNIEYESTDKNLYFVPKATGYYKVELNLRKGDSVYSFAVDSCFRVWNKVKAKFDYTIERFQDSIKVSFINQSEGDDLQYKWAFGDNTFSTHFSPQKTYTNNSIYSISLIAYNSLFKDTSHCTDCIVFGKMSKLSDIIQESNRLAESKSNYPFYSFGMSGYKLNDSIVGINQLFVESGNSIAEVTELTEVIEMDFLNIKGNYKVIDTMKIGAFYDLYRLSITNHYLNKHLNTTIINDSSYASILCYSSNTNYFDFSILNTNKLKKLNKQFYSSAQLQVEYLSASAIAINDTSCALIYSKIDLGKTHKLVINHYNTKMGLLKEEEILHKVEYIKALSNNTAEILVRNNNDIDVYHYSGESLNKQFTLLNIDSVMFSDVNNEINQRLYVVYNGSGKIKFITTDLSGNILKAGLIDDMPTIYDAKLSKDYILFAGADFSFIAYNFKTDLLTKFYDTGLTGDLKYITVLGKNSAMLVGSRYEINENFNIRQVNDLLYYFIDLDKPFTGYRDEKAMLTSNGVVFVYPNPANEMLNLSYSNIERQPAKIQIFNYMGLHIGEYEDNSGNIQIATNGLSVGTYFVKVTLGEKTMHSKFVVQR